MIKTKKELKEVLKYEKANYNITARNIFASYFGLSEKGIIWCFQKYLRKAEYNLNTNHKLRYLYYNIKKKRIGLKYSIFISCNCFDKGLKIMHLGPILVNNDARVGKNCMLHVQTAIVATNGNKDAPTLGDNVKIGIGSTLVGGIYISDGVAIGAGSVVVKSCNEENVTIGGIPAHIISRKGII